MKTTTLFSLFLGLIISAKSQVFTMNFDTATSISQYVKVDSTTDSLHLWQIGKPNKTTFGSAYSFPNSIITDSVNPYPIKAKSSFVIKTDGSQLIYSGLSFTHQYETDSLKDGGYVEYSLDTGINWRPIKVKSESSKPLLYNGQLFWEPVWVAEQNQIDFPKDTLPSGNPFFSGKSKGWKTSFIVFPCNSFKTESTIGSLWYRFSFFSDSIQTNKAGWIIDNIETNIGDTLACLHNGIKDIYQNKIALSPNPVSATLYINSIEKKYQAEIYDLTGRLYSTSTDTKEIDVSTLPTGIYLLRLKNEKGSVVKKFVKE